ncbi:hypothetical protein BUALT_Bualt06G0073700 [Buddleja alternifolia]|uniref:C2 domain-containing protein n=1 Tax=Buddleja alternifolia TaxID=168488 RepID=A0AAV6XEW7_9LAMI|nr:hypothetical protein BUALT_Bualt06G0073700 [Buddleja alternifolia]
MGRKIWVEVCLISARGLRRTSSLWKLQWFAVGWIDPENKYCTKIDSSGNSNPVWKTKFSMAIDASESNIQDLALHVEVYSREPIFLRQSLLGDATIVLKEFMDKYDDAKSEVSKPVEEVGSFQLRKRNSNKPQGFVDVSIRISEEREEASSSYLGSDEGFNLTDHNGTVNLATGYGPLQYQKPHLPVTTSQHPGSTNMIPIPLNYSHHSQVGGPNYTSAGGPDYPSASGHNYPSTGGPSYQPPRTPPPNYPSAGGPNYLSAGGPNYPSASGHNYPLAGGPSYQPPRTPPPPPPPPSNVGYIPNFPPRMNNFTPSYINLPSSAPPPGRGSGPSFGMGVGAGALAAGAVIFGNDFMSGFNVPSGLRDASLTISTDPPF